MHQVYIYESSGKEGRKEGRKWERKEGVRGCEEGKGEMKGAEGDDVLGSALLLKGLLCVSRMG